MDNGQIVNDLNTRQWNLYNFLKKQDKPLSRSKIMEETKLYDSPTRNTNKEYMSGGRLLTADLQAIKQSERITKVLITSRNGIYLAKTQEEANEYFDKEKKEVLKRLMLLIKQERQLSHHNQMLITFGDEEKIYIALNGKDDKDVR